MEEVSHDKSHHLVSSGKTLLESGRPAAALDPFLQAAALPNATGWTHFDVARCFRLLKNYERSLSHLKIAHKSIQDYKIKMELAYALSRLGKDEELEALFYQNIGDQKFITNAFKFLCGARDFRIALKFWRDHKTELSLILPQSDPWRQFLTDKYDVLASAKSFFDTCPKGSLAFSSQFPNFLRIIPDETLLSILNLSLDRHIFVNFSSWDLQRKLTDSSSLESVYSNIPLWIFEVAAIGPLLFVFDSSEEAPTINSDNVERFSQLISGGQPKNIKFLVLTANSILPAPSSEVSFIEYNIYPILVATPALSCGIDRRALTSGPFQYSFSLLNGMPRPHRCLFMILLQRSGLLERCNYSWWNNSNRKNTKGLRPYLSHALSLCPTLAITEDEVRWLESLADRTVDLPQTIQSSHDVCGSIPFDFLSSARFHVVSETEYFEKGKLRMTEKTFKPFLSGRPFLMLGVPGIIQYLRSHGFDLLDDYIDHSYDNENSAEQRFSKIVMEMIRLENVIVPDDRLEELARFNWEAVQRWTVAARNRCTNEFVSWLSA